MSAASISSPPRRALQAPLAVRLALRELRTGLSGFYVFVACIALGVAAIAGVGSLAGVLQESLAAQGQRILGGDFSARLVHRQANPAEREFLGQQGALGEVATMRAMARSADGEYSSLIDVTAVDAAYPLYGDLVIAGDRGAVTPADIQTTGVAAVDAGLLTRFDIELGQAVEIGEASVRIIATIENQPDRLSGRPALGPRVLMSIDTLKSTGLVQPGSLIRWWYRLRLADAFAGGEERLKSLRETIKERFPDAGFTLRDRTEPAPNVARAIERFSQFLTLVGVTTLMIGGLGVANAIATYLTRKRDVIAAFKCLGASRRTILATYLIQVLVLAGVGTVVGLAFGAAMPPAIAWAYGDVLPLELALGVQPLALAMASLYGLLTALLFVLWPLGRARDLPAARLLRDTVTSERARPAAGFIAAALICALALAGIAIASSYAKMLALYACLALAFCFAVYLSLGWALQAGARAMAPPRRVALALARAGLAAPGGLARPVALSLGTGLTLLTAVSLVNGALISEFRTSLPEKAPSYYVLDIDKTQFEPFRQLVADQAPSFGVATAPILRGRVVALRGVAADEIEAPEGVRWVLNGDRGLTFSATKPEDAKLMAGEWWPADYAGPPLVSVAAEIGKQLGLELGHKITVNVLGRPVEATVANFRTVDWDSLAINFVLVYSPNTLAEAPYKMLATLAVPPDTATVDEERAIQALAKSFPNLTVIRVQDAIEALLGVVGQIMVGVRAAGALTLIVGAIVLAGALATAHRRRMSDAVIFKTLGATRRRIIAAHMAEYLILAITTGAGALLLGSLAAYLIVVQVMDAKFSFSVAAAAQPILLAVGLVMAFGAFATSRVLSAKTVPLLRAE